MNRIAAAVAVGSLLAAGVARADGVHTHDGFYLRMGTGPSYMRASASGSGSDVTVSGNGLELGVAVGGSVAENLSLFGEVASSVSEAPTVEQDGSERVASRNSASVGGVGPRVAYYFMPLNLYVSGTLMLSRYKSAATVSRLGPGVSLMVGKEWWVSDNWGLGVAGRLFGASAKDRRDGDLTWTMSSVGIVFSATYN